MFVAGGSGKCLMFCQISPAGSNYQESSCSLKFALRLDCSSFEACSVLFCCRVRNVTLGQAKRQVQTGDLAKTQKQLNKAEGEARAKEEQMDSLKQQVSSMEDTLKEKDDAFVQLQQELRAKDAELQAA